MSIGRGIKLQKFVNKSHGKKKIINFIDLSRENITTLFSWIREKKHEFCQSVIRNHKNSSIDCEKNWKFFLIPSIAWKKNPTNFINWLQESIVKFVNNLRKKSRNLSVGLGKKSQNSLIVCRKIIMNFINMLQEKIAKFINRSMENIAKFIDCLQENNNEFHWYVEGKKLQNSLIGRWKILQNSPINQIRGKYCEIRLSVTGKNRENFQSDAGRNHEFH